MLANTSLEKPNLRTGAAEVEMNVLQEECTFCHWESTEALLPQGSSLGFSKNDLTPHHDFTVKTN